VENQLLDVIELGSLAQCLIQPTHWCSVAVRNVDGSNGANVEKQKRVRRMSLSRAAEINISEARFVMRVELMQRDHDAYIGVV